MTNNILETEKLMLDVTNLSVGEREEMVKLGLLSRKGKIKPSPYTPESLEKSPIIKRAVSVPGVLNEAYDYRPIPVSFSRALSLDIGGYKVLLISGTSSVDEGGKSIYVGDVRAQCWRTYRNITKILEAEEMTWHDILRTTCYLRDIERDYKDFNEIRTAFFHWLGLDPLPASTGIQARLCREDLLVEIEAIAVSCLK